LNDEPEGIFTALQALAVENLLRAHRVHPALLVETQGKLSTKLSWNVKHGKKKKSAKLTKLRKKRAKPPLPTRAVLSKTQIFKTTR
jgi:hypothetical protein